MPRMRAPHASECGRQPWPNRTRSRRRVARRAPTQCLVHSSASAASQPASMRSPACFQIGASKVTREDCRCGVPVVILCAPIFFKSRLGVSEYTFWMCPNSFATMGRKTLRGHDVAQWRNAARPTNFCWRPPNFCWGPPNFCRGTAACMEQGERTGTEEKNRVRSQSRKTDPRARPRPWPPSLPSGRLPGFPTFPPHSNL